MATVPTDVRVSDAESSLERIPLPAWLLFADCRASSCNSALLDYTGRPSSALEGDGWLAVIHPNDVEALRSRVAKQSDGPPSQPAECRILRSDGAWRWNDIHLTPTAEKLDPALLAIALDVHERRSEEEHARLLNQAAELLGSTLDPEKIYAHLRELISQSMVCDSLTVSIFDAEEQLIRCTYAWLEGETIEAATLPVIPLAPEGKGMQSAVIRTGESLLVNDFEEAARNSVTVYHVDTGGKIDTSETSSAPRTQAAILVPIKLDGKVLGVTRVLSNYKRDVYTSEHTRLLEALMSQVAAATRNAELYQRAREEIQERRKAEEQLLVKQHEVDALNERLVQAMQETHHRVKNNLQFICALVEMQVETGPEALPIHEFRRLGEHVRSLAAIHDILTDAAKEDADVETLSLAEALEKLLPMLERATRGRLIADEIQDIRIPIRQSAAVTILVNELVTNAVKHGEGDVKLSCSAEGQTARLVVEDSGPGFPHDFSPQEHGSTGLELVETLGKWDLRGDIRYENRDGGGGRVTVLFPIDKVSP